MLLAHDMVTAPGATPERTLVVLHGILGQGSNWRGAARRWTQARPEWGVLLVDLRAHGGSRALLPPDDIAAAADDLLTLRPVTAPPFSAVLGHSFGGKVALELFSRRPSGLKQLILVDSLPGADPGRADRAEAASVVNMLDTLPRSFASRKSFTAAVEAHGHPRGLARWLGQNLDRVDGGYELAIEVARIRALLNDYFHTDHWGVLDPPSGSIEAHLVIGGRSSVWSEADRERALGLGHVYPDQIFVHILPTADHWVHIDDPDGLHRVLLEAL